MSPPDRIEGTAIVSADGMIADAQGVQPASLLIGADQRIFHDALRRATAVAHGRNSAEGGGATVDRRRLILTRRVDRISRHPKNDNAVLWNPSGASLPQAWEALGLSGGLLLVIGGTDVYSLFLEIGYDAFHLSRAGKALLPGGRPLFSQVPAHSPEALLSSHGLKPGPVQVLDRDADLTLVSWLR